MGTNKDKATPDNIAIIYEDKVDNISYKALGLNGILK
ncbi:Pre-mRNA-splicing factor rse1 [Venturia inaequalis]|nr:Pre-mRNA-splicing factor rse1 [Venturia inaequalis]